MNKKRVTVEDVARVAGVSLMTVSRAINHRDGISDETRLRILEIAHQMNYHPSQIARSLATRQTNTLGLVVPDVSNPFFASIARGAEDAAYSNGYSIFLLNSAENPKRERAALDSLCQKEVQGVILCSSRLPQDELSGFLDRFERMVLVNRDMSSPHPVVYTINVDDLIGAEMVIKHFTNQGRMHIAFIAGPESSQSGQRRKNGYRLGLQSAGLPFIDSLVVHCEPTVQGGITATEQLLNRHDELDAIYAYNDLVAIGALQACRQNHKSVPAEIAVVGTDDVPLASLVQPALTSLHVNQYEIGSAAVSFLLKARSKDFEIPRSLVIQPELVIRESG